jgi:pyridoxal phosphate enzyme (YggS family)
VALFDMVQSVDSAALATALGRRAAELGKQQEVLLEVNIAHEASKFGAAEVEALEVAGAIAAVPGVRLCGLMGIGPLGGDPTATRESFRRLRRLFEQLPSEHAQVLSIGMTGDFEIAIEEGSTMVRVGTAIFGPRNMPAG